MARAGRNCESRATESPRSVLDCASPLALCLSALFLHAPLATTVSITTTIGFAPSFCLLPANATDYCAVSIPEPKVRSPDFSWLGVPARFTVQYTVSPPRGFSRDPPRSQNKPASHRIDRDGLKLCEHAVAHQTRLTVENRGVMQASLNIR